MWGGEANSSLSFTWGQFHVPVALTTVLIEKYDGWAPQSVWTFRRKISCLYRESNHGSSDVRPAAWSLCRLRQPHPSFGRKPIPEKVTLAWSFLSWDLNGKQVCKSPTKLNLEEKTGVADWKQAYRAVATETAGSTQ
jgi:hypothetical protein